MKVSLTVAAAIAEDLADFNEDLQYRVDDDILSFNVKNTEKGYRLSYDISTGETKKLSLDNPDTVATDTDIVMSSIQRKEYLVLTDDPMNIPLLYSHGIDYIFYSSTDSLSDKHLTALADSKLLITTSKEIKDDLTDALFLDFSGITPDYKYGDSLLVVASRANVHPEEISKFIYSKYKTLVPSEKLLSNSNTKTANAEDNKTPARDQAMENKSLPIESLISDEKYQFREIEDPEAIKDLSFAYKKGEVTAPIEVVATEDSQYIIVDGNHRYKGAKVAGLEYVDCIVVAHGSTHDAFKLSLGANNNNKALRRSYKDMRKAVHAAINCKEFRDLSNRKIADICKVSSSLVDKIKKELAKDDVVPKINTAHVGTLDHDGVKDEKADDDTEAHSHVDKPKSTTSRKKTKAFSEKIKNESLTIVVTAKSRPNNQKSYQGLLTDLQSVIDLYISDFKEAI